MTGPTIFAFTRGPTSIGEWTALAILSTGGVVATRHARTAEEAQRVMLGCTEYAARFPDGFNVVWLDDPEGHPVVGPLLPPKVSP